MSIQRHRVGKLHCYHCQPSPLLFDSEITHEEVTILKMTTPATLNETELDEIYSFAIQLARQAGQMLLDAVDVRSGQTGGVRHVEKELVVDQMKVSLSPVLQAKHQDATLLPLLISIAPRRDATQFGEDCTCSVTKVPYLALIADRIFSRFVHRLLTRWLHERRRGFYS